MKFRCTHPAATLEVSIVAAMTLLTVLFAVGCATPPDRDIEQVEPTFELPEDWYHHDADGEPVDDDWCADFGEPELAQLLERVFEHNLDLQMAQARIEESRALLEQQRARRMPRIAAQAGAGAEFGPDGLGTAYEISVPAAYEVDLWGRIAHQIASAETEMEATETDLRALEMALAAETAEQYYELARIRAELDLIDDQLRAARTFLELTEVRQAQGMAEGLDVVQQRQQIEELQEMRRRAELDEELAINALATLKGLPPGQFAPPIADELPEEVPPVTDTTPADLLENRPDVHAARLRVIAAFEDVDAAALQRLPSLQLTPELGLQATSLARLFTSLFITAVAEASQPIWEGGRLQARIDEEEALLEQRYFEFSAVLLEAIREVEDTLVRGEGLYDILQAQRRQLDSAEEALDIAREQYRAGILDYLRVLTALQSVQQLELAELESRRAVLSQRIQLCRVAGGHWPTPSIQEEPDEDDAEQDDDGSQGDEPS